MWLDGRGVDLGAELLGSSKDLARAHAPPSPGAGLPGMETAGPSLPWRAANGGEIVFGLLGQTAAQLPRLTRRHDPFLGVRVGEAANPGPQGSRRTQRARAKKAAFSGSGLAELVSAMVQALLPALLAALAGGGQVLGAAAAGSKKEKDKKQDVKAAPPGPEKAAVARARTADHAAAGSAAKPKAKEP